jgi:hypothetical protein
MHAGPVAKYRRVIPALPSHNAHKRSAMQEPHLEVRRNMQSRWIWVLLSADLHVVNRSEADFATRQECVADADLNDF